MSLKRFRGGSASISDDSKKGQRSSQGRILYEAIVTNFFSNPEEDLQKNPPNDSTLTYRESLEKGLNKVTNSFLISRMPRCSITAIVTSEGAAWGDSQPEIFYPLFPHMTLPVKPGEKVWVIYETANRKKSSRGYWISRIAADIKVDDPNYTHKDREFLYNSVPSSQGPLEVAEGTSSFDESTVFSFLAGSSGNVSENTLPGEDPYNKIVGSSLSYAEQFTGEPVPRFSPRVGDLTIEGSNNTLICLGQDRPGMTSAAGAPDETGSGTIDIVAGRGQTDETGIVSTVTISKRANNLSDYEEGNKFPNFDGSSESNIEEGNPDFVSDLSRIYVSMNTDGDRNFGLVDDAGVSVGNAGILPSDTETGDSGTGPYVVVKSTNPRIIAREDGSIKIMHEGGSAIIMDSNGNIQISTSGTITMGKAGKDLAAGGQDPQSFVRGETMVEVFNTLLAALQLMSSTLSGGGSTPGLGYPNPVLASAMLALNTTLTSQLGTGFTSDMANSLSDVIKGE